MTFSAGCANGSSCDSVVTVTTSHSQDYSVTVTNAHGCSVVSTVHIAVSAQPSVFVPSGFKPNNDGLNDYFVFDILGAVSANVQIWNRWGDLVFSNPDQANGMNAPNAWNGQYRGQVVPFDTYTYQFDVTYYDGHHQTISGTVIVMR
jgi:gliding motility-associated-like protein